MAIRRGCSHLRIRTLTKATWYLHGTDRYVPGQMIEERIGYSSLGRLLRPSVSGFDNLVDT
jgi:hypothetical protein